MNFPSISLKHVLVSFGCLFVAAVIFVSILGENNNGVNATRIFLTAVKDRDHNEMQRSYSRTAKSFTSQEESTRYHFMVELAMLDHFELLDADDYRMDIDAESLWFPFISDRHLQMNVRFTPMDGGSLLHSSNQLPYIERAVTAVREDGRWKIEGFNLKDSDLKRYYQETVAKVEYHKFIAMANDVITLNTQAIDLKQMSGLDRKVFIHSLENAIASTRASTGTSATMAAVQ